MAIGFCVLGLHTRDRGYDLLRAVGSASHTNQVVRLYYLLGASDDHTAAQELRDTSCFGHFIGFCVLLCFTEKGRIWYGH